MTLNNQYAFFQTVFLRTDHEQRPRLVTRIQIQPGGILLYSLACATSESWHYEQEIADSVDILMQVNG